MPYCVIWDPKAEDDLKSTPSEIAKRIIKKVIELELTPYHFVEKLTDVDCWKLRVGDYRVLMDIDEEKKQILVLKVGHRKNIYK